MYPNFDRVLDCTETVVMTTQTFHKLTSGTMTISQKEEKMYHRNNFTKNLRKFLVCFPRAYRGKTQNPWAVITCATTRSHDVRDQGKRANERLLSAKRLHNLKTLS